MIETFDGVLERIDADPAAYVGGSSTTDDLFQILGGHIGESCGQSGAGTAFSEILIYIADQAKTRPAGTASIIEWFLDSLCSDPPVELTVRGRTACAGRE